VDHDTPESIDRLLRAVAAEGDGPDLAESLASLAKTEHARGDEVADRRALDESIAMWTAIAEHDPESEQRCRSSTSYGSSRPSSSSDSARSSQS
jgi:hypothetical protein